MLFYAWVPLVSATDFAGINTDLGTIAAGIIAACVIIIGVGLLVRVFSH